MSRRKPRDQVTHDRKVSRLASELEKQGYTVQASTGSRPDPNPIGRPGMMPDIVATKGGKTKIIEVKTPRGLKADMIKLQKFAKYAAKRKDVTFDIVVTKPRRKIGATKKVSVSKTSKKK